MSVLATVGIFVYWYCYYDWAHDGHQLIPFDQLRNWSECTHWENFSVRGFDNFNFDKDPCGYFTYGKVKASTLSLTVLVIIEMFNAVNALSEDSSFFRLDSGSTLSCFLLLLCLLSYTASFCTFLSFKRSSLPLHSTNKTGCWPSHSHSRCLLLKRSSRQSPELEITLLLLL